jgi:metal-responsive CopG/Arc/MetJ family transcriptional regulator
MQERRIELPDHLAQQVDQYLKEHPGETLSHLIQEALAVKVERKDLSRLLELSGIVSETVDHQVERDEAQT